MNIKRT